MNTETSLKEKLKLKWDGLHSKQKRMYLIGSLVLVVVAFSLALKGPKKVPKAVQEETTKQQAKGLVLEPDFTQTDVLQRLESQFQAMQEKQDRMEADQKYYETRQSEVLTTSNESGIPGPVKADASSALADLSTITPPPPVNAVLLSQSKPAKTASFFNPGAGADESKEVTSQFIGEIIHLEGDKSSEIADTKKNTKVYLPPSHMPATLLTGVKAHTIKGADKDPLQIMLRIQAPAILPNEIKAQLQGCFVIADAFGRLDTKRIEARMVSLSCLDKKGESLIDETIDGFIVDSDGSVGLAGHVYSHMDESVGYAFWAGVVGGIGKDVQAQNTSIITSTQGTLTTYDPDRSLQAGFAGGIADGSDELKKIYLDIVKQAAPVIETGSMKQVTIVISKGKYLIIKEVEG